ncbi:MAG TPA: M14 family zinc carboxypeptidase [Terriglobales bacterium]|nr:M14 family zinc carboxypeptidase [Terriglobales bacterium]
MPFPRPLAIALAIAALLSIAPAAPASPPHAKLVRVALDASLTLETILREGFDIASVKGGAWVDLVAHPGDEARLQALGARTEVIDDDLEAHYAQRAARDLASRPQSAPARVRSAARPDGVFRIEQLPPFGSGSMGGFWTLAEVKMKLDSLVASDTRDLVADKVDTIGWSIEGRPIWGLRIGKAVTGPDTRPAVYFNALTHAREPEGMQATFWFVDDLLANYDTDPFAHYLLDQRVIYICPIVNPDGYAYNQVYAPDGGGSWRKNRRLNTGGTYGVDLNRNYSMWWGYDNIGSSPTPGSETYRGTAPFSEPETQAQRDIVVSLQPATGISFHTYADDFLHPWGYSNVAPADSAVWYEWNDEATLGTTYIAGEGPRVLYATNGDFNDWTYGDTRLKPLCYSWTPEIGTDGDGFWPAPSRIVPLARENLRKCYVVAAVAGPWVRIESSLLVESSLDAGFGARLAVRARNRGLRATPENLVGTIVPLDAGAGVWPYARTVPYPPLPPLSSADATEGATFTIAADDTVTPGRMLRWAVEFTADSAFYSRDTVEVIVGRPTVLLSEACNATTNWTISSGWGVVANDAGHPDHYFTDSPSGNYPNNANLRLTCNSTLNLTGGVHAWILLDAKWYSEQTYDGTLVEASLDGTNWTQLAGRGTSPAVYQSSSQLIGKPVYQCFRASWMPDRLDLSAFAGPAGSAVRLRLRTVSDSGLNYDGFRFDSLRVLVYEPVQQPTPALAAGDVAGARFEFAAPWPNPARGESHLGFTLPRAAAVTLEVHDVQGRRVRALANGRYAPGRYALAWDLRDDAGRPVAPGLYLARIAGDAGTSVRRIVVLH